jgi:hypothetical protein
LYETHLHTCLGSACGVSRGRDYLSRYRDIGYSGIIMTEHFFRGNTAISRSLPWKSWVGELYRSWEETREAGAKIGIDVFFGWEETFDSCDDYLVYGLDKSWLLEHPESRQWTRKQQFDEVNKYGGCVVQAHPFRQHYYIDTVILSSGCVNAVEAANAGNHEQSYDSLAMRYAQKLGLPMTAGSDIHNVNQLEGGAVFGVYLDKKMESIADYVKAVKENTIAGLRMSEGRCDYHGNEYNRLPVELRDKNDRVSQRPLSDLLNS